MALKQTAMKHLTTTLLFLFILAFAAKAQNTYDCEITLLENDEKTALFSVSVDVDKKASVEKCACEALLTTLLTQGVSGIHNGQPVSSKELKYWRNENNLFKQEANFLKYTTYQLEYEPIINSSGKLHGNVYVKLNLESFLRYLEKYGVLAK